MFESLKKLFSIKKEFSQMENLSDLLNYSQSNSPYYLRGLSRSDYLRLYTSWTYASITTIADSISDLEFRLKKNRDSNRDLKHPYLDFITPDFLESITSHIKLNGECFVYKSMIGNKIDSLEILRPDCIYIDQIPGGDFIGYRYIFSGYSISLKKEDLIIFKNFSPYDTKGYVAHGIGDIQAIAVQAESDNAAINWNWNYFRKNASPGAVIEIDKDNLKLDSNEIERVKTAWRNKHAGVNNAHDIEVLGRGMKFVELNRSQKEMDFVESRRFTRDEILGIFKVPKAVLGLGEGVNVGNVKEFERIFAKRTIKPLAKQISETLNLQLFNGIGYFEFINIVPADTEELRHSVDVGAMTINEYRNKIGLENIKEGDILKLDPLKVVTVATDQENAGKGHLNESFSFIKGVDFKKLLKKNIKWTDEYMDDEIKKKDNRLLGFEKKYKDQLKKVWKIQEEDILKQIKEKQIKEVEEDIAWQSLKYIALYEAFMEEVQRDLMQDEGQYAINELGIDATFEIGNPDFVRYMKDNIARFGKDIDLTTKEKILDVIIEGNKEGLGANQIRKKVSDVFTELNTTRAQIIVRTETIDASTKATLEAWEQSGVVEGKQWYTALDERVCDRCGPMHGTKTGLKTNFFNQGDTDLGGVALEYKDIIGPTLHPQCRCALIPIVEE